MIGELDRGLEINLAISGIVATAPARTTRLYYALTETGLVPASPYLSWVAFAEHLSGGAIDGAARRSEDGGMSEVTSATPRRSGRVFHKVHLQAQGRGHNGKKFRESCQTVVVSAHGGLLLLRHEVDNGEMLVLTNPETQEEQECRVVYLGDPGDKGQRIGVEFLTPAPRFWGVEFEDKFSSANGGISALH